MKGRMHFSAVHGIILHWGRLNEWKCALCAFFFSYSTVLLVMHRIGCCCLTYEKKKLNEKKNKNIKDENIWFFQHSYEIYLAPKFLVICLHVCLTRVLWKSVRISYIIKIWKRKCVESEFGLNSRTMRDWRKMRISKYAMENSCERRACALFMLSESMLHISMWT